MKKIIFIIIAILAATVVVVISKGKLQDKGNLMDNSNSNKKIMPPRLVGRLATTIVMEDGLYIG